MTITTKFNKRLSKNQKSKKNLHSFKLSFFMILVTLFYSVDFFSQNLIRNGDFEEGGSGIGFVVKGSGYTPLTAPFSGTTVPGNYGFTTNPQLMNTTDFIAGGDHTSGSGKMMVIDGNTLGTLKRFWQVGATGNGVCGLTIGETYTFSYWLKSVSNIGTPASIEVFLTGVSDVSPAISTTIATPQWQKITYTFKVTTGCVSIELFNNNVTALGNDFAVDDFSLLAPPVALSLSYTFNNPLCPDSIDGTITATGVGGNFPYSSYTLTGGGISPVTNTNGIFTGLAAGTYSISITDEGNNTAQKNNIILTNPNNLTTSPNVTICQGSSTTLTVSGSSASYTWTASPQDLSLTTPNIANPIVQPTQTTTYTVTSNPISDNTPNLVINGDFSEGNRYYINDYQYLDNGGGGIQRAYGVVSNPKNWFGPFGDCRDHTTGTGLMLVADGSTLNSGNDRIWEQTIAVVPNKSYTFSYWVQTVALPDPADLQVEINGVSIGKDLAPPTVCGWAQRKYVWNSGSNTTATIAIYDKKTMPNGNDFALDDIVFKINTTCSLSKSVTVTVNSSIVPTFSITSSYCTGSSIPALPTTSNNGITGTWSPAINSAATTEYTFTPNAGQCAISTKITLEISTSITPTFTPIAPICSGATLSALPTTSTNGITGVWSPALNNNATTEYTFTPNAGQCGIPAKLTIAVNPTTTPTFDAIAPICSGETPAALPTISNNGISGNWSPAINNEATTTYTFTPNADQCATSTIQTIIVGSSSVSITSECIDTDYTLEAITADENATFKWYKGETQLQGQTSNRLIVTTADIYKVVISSNGCPGEATENVVSFYCDIPKGISPNGDTKNDFFDLGNFSVNKLEIFNRYGIKVYTKSEYKNEWDGKSDNGQELPDGTYYYVVEFEGGKSKTGWVYLNREH